MSQCIVPNWNLRKEQDEGEAGKRSSHVHTQLPNLPLPMSNYDQVAELVWENGHLAMHGLGGPAHLLSTKPTFNAAAAGGKGGDTLESLVQQATHHKRVPDPSSYNYHCKKENMSSVAASSAGKWVVGDSLGSSSTGKRQQKAEQSQQKQETETNTTTWTSFDSHGSLMQQAMSADEDSPACRGELKNAGDERDDRKENGRSFSTRRSRATSVHNQSERKRRDRINQKMKALQKLVPNARKTDKASMLDEVIEYLKQLQAQLKMMSQLRNMPHHQMMMPLGMQQQLQMSLFARMGMGMLDHMTPPPPPNPPTPHQTMPSLLHSTSTGPTPAFLPPSLLIPSFLSTHHSSAPPLPDSYAAFLTQSMNADIYNKMTALYQQQINQTTQVGAPLHGTNGPRG